MTSRKASLLSLFFLILAPVLARAQPAAPPPPAEYDIRLRYRILAGRNERLVQFFALTKYLESIGFRKDPGPDNEAEDPEATRMTGTIAAANARRLLGDRHVRSVLLLPKGTKLPEQADQPVRVQIDLTGGFSPDRQRVFADQVRGVLAASGFRESVGYDNRGHTRLVGMAPAGKLDLLVEDLRRVSGADQLPAPFASVSPIVLTEVMPAVPAPKDAVATPVQDPLGKLSPELRGAAGEAAERLEVILANTPLPGDNAWPAALYHAVPGLVIEGRLGPLVTVLAKPAQLPALAAVPEVAGIRRPRTAELPPPAVASQTGDAEQAVRAAGLDRLHAAGARGQGIQLAIIDSDFRGLAAAKSFRKKPRLIDLTAERNTSLEPDKYTGDANQTGHGTRCAQAAALAAPEAELTLIRIDPAVPYQLLMVARALGGDSFLTESLTTRGDELDAARQELKERLTKLSEERRLVLNNFSQDEEIVKRREAYFKALEQYRRDERALQQRVDRYLALFRDLRALKDVRVVASPLTWGEGQPVDGSGPLSRYFDDRPLAPVWFQAAGDTRGQAWSGLFRDADGNGVMEFAAADTALKPGRWTRELNFLAWQPWDGAQAAELPAGTRVRVSVQWREAHDPEFLRNGEDLFRDPLATLRLVVLRQRDPSATKLPADDLEVVARSSGPPQRLLNHAGSATYELTVEFTAETAGRYVLRVEGQAPVGTRPASVPTLPALQQTGELRPRIFLATRQGAGRAVFADYPTDEGSIGVPGDAQRAVTVGAGEPSSAKGPPMNLELLTKPNVVATDRVGVGGRGTGIAASFTAGVAASALSGGASQGKFLQGLDTPPGGPLRVR